MNRPLFLHISFSLMALASIGQPRNNANTEQLKRSLNQKLSQKSVTFEENKGQMKDQHWKPRPDVLFNGTSQGMNYYIRNNGMSYQLSRVESWKEEEHDPANRLEKEKRKAPDRMGTYRVDVQWLNANHNYSLEKGKELPGYSNYYNVPEGVEPALFVKQYESVTLKNLWRGIDLQFYGTDGLLETDWLVAPGADYRQIQFEIKGAEVSVNSEGCLVMKTPFGEIREGTLKVYQNNELLQAKWVVSQSHKKGPAKISFNVQNFNPAIAMRIDPLVRAWGTYYGGSDDEIFRFCTTDASSNVYLSGNTQSAASIASGGHQNVYGGSYDAFLVKFNSDGVQQWGTYYGEGGYEVGESCATDENGNVYLSGVTSSGIAIASNGFQNTFGDGTYDAFLVKFNSSGIRQWGTYYGGSDWDIGDRCVTDNSGNVYLTGWTKSTNAIASGGHQNTFGGGVYDAFLVKFNSTGLRQWATYYGGSGDDGGESCTTDKSGNVYMSGMTQSVSAIAASGHQSIWGGGNPGNPEDAFLVKFNSDGVRQWGTYYGGSGEERGPSCSTDDSGNVYLAGSTFSGNSIASGGHQNTFGGGSHDAYLAKFNSDGVRQWGTYYGGNGRDYGYSCTADDSGNIYLAGLTRSTLGIASGGYQNTLVGDYDAYVVQFNSNGVRQWGTYYGSIGDDEGFSCIVDKSGNIYLAGGSHSTNGIASRGHQGKFGGGYYDAFLVKFKHPLIAGVVWQDLNRNCIQESTEVVGIGNVCLSIQPGDFIVASENGGIWYIDSLPPNTYTVTVDTSNNNWILTCPVSQTFTVTNSNNFIAAPSFGFQSKYPCAKPHVVITMPRIRRGFSNQAIYVYVSNETTATDSMNNAYCIITLDSFIGLQSASHPFIALDNNSYRFDVGTLYPGQYVNITIIAMVSTGTVTGQTLCISAELFPQSNCVFDSVPTPPTLDYIPCADPYDASHIVIKGLCQNDSIYFVVTNDGEDMLCPTRIRVYVDAEYKYFDAIFLASGESKLFVYEGDGKTWRMEADQHLFHPGESRPSASIERCGNLAGWTPGIINTMPQDDADPVIDIFCGQVNAPLDPNDKTGFPLGIGSTHTIQRNQQIEYLIRFQNVGTDTAVDVVIRDTLSTDLDIFSVRSGVSSHAYDFRMYGQRVLEWTFRNIMLPDSNINEPASNGFVKFDVKQQPDLPYSTVIKNSAAIYFDFEDPVITNTYFHTVSPPQSIVGVQNLFNDENVVLKVVPNPFSQTARIEIEGLENHNHLSFEMYNVFGQLVKTLSPFNARFEIERNNLSGGIYFFQLKQNDKVVGNGKMVVN